MLVETAGKVNAERKNGVNRLILASDCLIHRAAIVGRRDPDTRRVPDVS